MARLDRLSGPSKEVAQIASIIGREFDRNLLAQVAPIEATILRDALSKLLAAQLVVMGGASQQTLLFCHALIQDAAYQTLLTRKRVNYHQAVADAIVGLHPDIVATQPELIARHYTEGRRDDLAFPYWMKAGERALERSAISRTRWRSLRGVRKGQSGLLKHLPRGLGLPKLSSKWGGTNAAAPCYLMAAEQARQANDSVSFVRGALGYDDSQFLSGLPLDRSVALLVEAEEKIASDDDKQRCLILCRLGRAHLLLGDAEKSRSLGDRAGELARRLGIRRALFDLLVNRILVPRPAASLSRSPTSCAGGRGQALRSPAEADKAMPRNGALTLADIRGPTLTIVCEPCGRRGRYSRSSSSSTATRSSPISSRRSPTVRRRIPPASMTGARPCTREGL
jgi:hypothetical protein